MRSELRRLFQGVFRASCFSADTRDYFTNSKKALLSSFLVPWAVLLIINLNFHPPGASHVHAGALYAMLVFVDFLIAAPKFVIFYALVWQLCCFFGKTDHFRAFITANNWLYVIYGLFFLAVYLGGLNHLGSASWILQRVMILYLYMIVFFLGQNILRLAQEIAWIVPVTSAVTHILILMVTGKNGSLFVF